MSADMIKHYLDFIVYRALAQLKTESSRAYMGYAWWVLEPLLYLSVFYVVFGLVFNRGDAQYLDILITGLVVWKWFDGSVRGAMDSIHSNAGLIDKVYLPKIVLPSIAVAANTIKFFLILALLLIFHAWRSGLSPYWLALALLLPLQLLLVFSASCLVAAVTPFIPDLKLVFDKLMTMLFFLSGVFYSLENIAPELRPWFQLNPMFELINAYRGILVHQQWPEMASLLYIAAISVFCLLAGSYLLLHYDRLYPRLNQ